LYLCW